MSSIAAAGVAGGDGHTRRLQLIKVLEANATAFEQELAELDEKFEVRPTLCQCTTATSGL